VFLVAKNGDWGKIEINGGSIVSMAFKSARGREVLQLLGKLEELQFLFQEQKGPPKSHEPHHKTPISNQEFFKYFGMDLQVGVREIEQDSFEATQPIDQAVIKQATSAARQTVLVVDDSALARKAARVPLEASGYQVVEAKDGFEALGQLQNEDPRLVLLDLVMPGIDGYRVLEMIRANPKFKQLPVIMLTSRDGLLDKIKGRMSDLDEYLTKPFNSDQLIEIVTKHLDA